VDQFLGSSPDLASGDPILVSLSYNGSTLTETLTDQTTSQTFHTSYAVDLAGVLGSTALVGFTGSTGGGSSVQTITNFTYAPTSVPEPGSFVLLGIGLVAVTTYQRWRCRRLA
jgi:hypothetical protein